MCLPALLLGLVLASPAQAFLTSQALPFERLSSSPSHMGATTCLQTLPSGQDRFGTIFET